jgi:integrase
LNPLQHMAALTSLVEEFIEDRKGQVRRGNLSPKTVREYRQPLEKVLLPFCEREGIVGASELNPKALDRLTDHLLTNGATSGKTLSRATINSYLRSVRVFLNWAEKQGATVGKVTLLENESAHIRPLTRPEITRIENAAERERDRLIIRLLADTGIRVGELISLRVDDLIPAGSKFFIRVRGKTGERDVAIMPELHKRLKRYIAETRPKKSESNRVFLGLRRRPGGGVEPLTESGVQQVVRELAQTAEIGRRVHPHLFRHSAATHLLNNGVSPLHVKTILGHKSLAMIDRTYSHITPVDTYDALRLALQADRA